MPEAVTEQDRLHLASALELAGRGRGRVSPNPLVGAVLVRDGKVLGEGWHSELGGLHAERAALADCAQRGNDPAGATAYVTLEPCAHVGHQPACADALIESRIARVVYASDDPSAKASGRGPGMLRDAGIETLLADGDEAAAARLQNQPFRKHARTGKPLVTIKFAATMDGRTATAAGDSRWISGPAARAMVHAWRAGADAVAVGIGTVLADDPLLTARDVTPAPAVQPVRVVFDAGARLPVDSALVASVADAPTLVVCSPTAEPARIDSLRSAGVDVLALEGDPPSRVTAALAELGARGITSLLVEGGAGLIGSFVDAGEIDEVKAFIAPILLGGEGAVPVAAGHGARKIDQAQRAVAVEHERVGDDLLIRARMREW